MDYRKNLLNELRVVGYKKDDSSVLTEENLVKAVTLNENLKSLGYTLTPNGIVAIATSESLFTLYNDIESMMDTIDAEPMYPNFPEEVMNIDEATFRFHQRVHYFSTYGMKLVFGVDVKHGWLPHEGEHSGTEKQKIVLKEKVIELIPEDEIFIYPVKTILSRRERMTLPEKEIVKFAISHISKEQASSLDVKFKENMNELYNIIFELDNKEDAFTILRSVCKHTGDVLRCIRVVLNKNKWHLHTSQKRFFVQLLENYPVYDFKGNLILSNKNAEQNINLLGYIDYSVYSKSAEHMEAVRELRNSELKSWYSIVESKLQNKDDDVLEFISARPGNMLRMAVRLLRAGYTAESISKNLCKNVSSLSIQTLVSNLNVFGKDREDWEDGEDILKEFERRDAYSIFDCVLKERMKKMDTVLKNKSVFFDFNKEYALNMSEIRTNNKSAEGGYIRSGIAYRIPDGINRVRFFVYWNDKERVDVDLHASAINTHGGDIFIGWDSDFRNNGIVFSGDITHSNAAEYIDIDLNKDIDKVFTNIHLFSGKESFDKIETCYVGMMAVPSKNSKNSKNDEELYSEANCFFKHNLRQSITNMNYGYIDVKNRCIVFIGEDAHKNRETGIGYYTKTNNIVGRFSLAKYLEHLLIAQSVSVCSDKEKADIILVMGKASNDKEVSLIDNNFFME